MSSNALLSNRKFFAPRRLGHANVFVGDYEKAFSFYHDIVGFEEVYRQPDNRASFISNGNTYHDMALTDVKSKYASPGQEPGLFHIAFELENEVRLVEGYRNAVAAGVSFEHTADHDVAHSLYQSDPDGNGVELYADVVEDWRTARHGIIVKKKPEWIPGVTTEPIEVSLHPKEPEIRVVEHSIFHARRVTHVGFMADDFEALFDYYIGVIGLEVLIGTRTADFAVLRGVASNGDVTLLRGRDGEARGMHHVGIEVASEVDLARALKALPGVGIGVEAEIDHPARHTVCIRDPDGMLLQFYVNRDWNAAALAGVTREQAPYLL
ncbi:MAG TPA: VOC family protein [Caldimonas sp.]|nr:VOC family protein [Caldimonas sp.]